MAHRAGLGRVGAGASGEQGVLLHSLVAARWPTSDPPAGAARPPLPLLGLLDQQFYVRQARPAAEKAHRHGGGRPRQGRARESALWARSLRTVGSPPATGRWVVVADCGVDIYEPLRQCRQQGLGFVVRAAEDRGLVTPLEAAPTPTLFAVARAQPSGGQLELALRARPG
jgi:hypothetical protein